MVKIKSWQVFKVNHKTRNFLIFLVDVPIFVNSEEFSENIIGDTEKSSAETKINVMAPPAPPTVSLMSIDLQQEPSDLQALAAVKAELLEETSQSSLMSGTGSESNMSESMQSTFSPNVTQHCPEREDSEKMDIVQNTVGMMISHQPLTILPGEMIELQIKQEIARRGSLTQQDEYILGVESPVSLNQTSNINTGALFPQSVPIQTDAQKSQMLMDHYQTSLVAATAAQLSLHSSQDVLMTQNPATIRSSENIMNTNIAPTIMVPTVHGGLETVNPILSSNVLASDTNALLSVNVAAPPPSTVVVPPSMPMEQDQQLSIHERTSPVAVKTMILNAAAEILSSPEQPSAETRSTINALIALNTEEILNGAKHDDTTSVNPTASHTSSSNLTASHLLDKEIR